MKILLTLMIGATLALSTSVFAGDCGGCEGKKKGDDNGGSGEKTEAANVEFAL